MTRVLYQQHRLAITCNDTILPHPKAFRSRHNAPLSRPRTCISRACISKPPPSLTHCSSSLPSLHGPSPMSADFWAGYISGAIGIVVGNPLDLLKTRLQAGSSDVHATSASSLRTNFDSAGTLLRGQSPSSPSPARQTVLTKSRHRSNRPHPHVRRSQRPPFYHLQP